jgi:hypothetical protein
MYVFGNGESRTSIDIDKLDGPKIGCNAIYRDYHMDHLICVDRRMVNEALENQVNENGTYVHTRKDWFNNFQNKKKLRIVPDLPYCGSERADDPFHWGSGPYAVLLAAKKSKNETVNLLGFDLYSKDTRVNNVYKSTSHYDNGTKRAVDPRYWIHQIGKTFECFKKVKFIVYAEDNWTLPKQWKYSNVSLDKISNLV